MKKLHVMFLLNLVVVVALAACAGSTPTTAPTQAAGGATEAAGGTATEAAPTEEAATEVAQPPQQGDNVLNIYNWSTYIAPEMIPAFEKKYGVKVNYDLFGSNDELLAKIQPGNPGYDIIVPTGYMVEIMIKQDLLEKLDKSKLSNFNNIDKKFLDPPFDPGNQYCVPYQWGTVGLGYNVNKTGKELDSFDVMFNGEYSGRIAWQDEERITMAAALLYLGYDPNTIKPEEITAAKDLLIKTKKDVKAFAPDTGQDLLVQGDVDIAYEYSGDIFQVQADHPEMHYVIPKEGAVIWTDNLCIPTGAPHADMAHKFIDFILDAQNGATLSNYTAYGTPNAASLPMITKDLLDNPGIYPPPEVMKKLSFTRSLGEVDALYDEAWTELGVGQ